MSVILTLGAVALLAADPHCGAASPDSDLARRLVATATAESGGNPYFIGVNAEPSRGLRKFSVSSATVAEAVSRARALWAQGRRIDIGLLQISDAQLARHHLTIETAFDACRNMAAASEHLSDDFKLAWSLSSRIYNCGRPDCGVAYATRVDALVDTQQRVRASPDATPTNAPDPCHTEDEDGWHTAARPAGCPPEPDEKSDTHEEPHDP